MLRNKNDRSHCIWFEELLVQFIPRMTLDALKIAQE